MKKLLIIVACLFSFHVYNNGNIAQSSSDTLRVMTFNIHAGVGIDKQFNIERIANLIIENDIDIAGLQEVDKNTNRSNQTDIAKQIAELTGMNYVYGANIFFDGGEYGNAILSRYPIVESENILLPRLGNNEQRGLLKTKIKVGDKTISAWNVHMDHQLDNSERILSVKKILDEMRNESNNELILLGDFNDTPQSKVIRLVKVHFSDGTIVEQEINQFTFPADKPERKIDYIFLKRTFGANQNRIIESKVIKSNASDHLPLMTLIELSTAR